MKNIRFLFFFFKFSIFFFFGGKIFSIFEWACFRNDYGYFMIKIIFICNLLF